MLNLTFEILEFLLPTISSETHCEFRRVPAPELSTVALVSAASI